jgi:hypothetical protein
MGIYNRTYLALIDSLYRMIYNNIRLINNTYMKTLYKIIDIILLYTIGKRLVITNGRTSRSVQNGRYIGTTKKTKYIGDVRMSVGLDRFNN